MKFTTKCGFICRSIWVRCLEHRCNSGGRVPVKSPHIEDIWSDWKIPQQWIPPSHLCLCREKLQQWGWSSSLNTKWVYYHWSHKMGMAIWPSRRCALQKDGTTQLTNLPTLLEKGPSWLALSHLLTPNVSNISPSLQMSSGVSSRRWELQILSAMQVNEVNTLPSKFLQLLDVMWCGKDWKVTVTTKWIYQSQTEWSRLTAQLRGRYSLDSLITHTYSSYVLTCALLLVLLSWVWCRILQVGLMAFHLFLLQCSAAPYTYAPITWEPSKM